MKKISLIIIRIIIYILYHTFPCFASKIVLQITTVFDNKEIKKHERKEDFTPVKKSKMDEIRELILLNSANPDFEIRCPLCNSKLITRIAKLYDLEDNLVLHPKARCSKCPFQLSDN